MLFLFNLRFTEDRPQWNPLIGARGAAFHRAGIRAKPPYHFRQGWIGLSQLHLEAEKKIV